MSVRLNNGRTLLSWLGHGQPGHRPTAVCFCGLDVSSSTGIQNLVYDFRECSCDQHPYPHLVEHLSHRDCFLDAGDDATGTGEAS